MTEEKHDIHDVHDIKDKRVEKNKSIIPSLFGSGNGGGDTDDIMGLMMNVVMITLLVYFMTQFFTSGTNSMAQTYYSTQMYEGKKITRTIHADGVLNTLNFVAEEPFAALMSLYIVNYGPDDVHIGIDTPDEMFTLGPCGYKSFNRTGALNRINAIFFKCDGPNVARLELIGEY